MPVTLRKYVGGLAGLAGLSLTNASPGECLFWPCSRSVWLGLAGRYATICPAGFAAMLVRLACFSAGLSRESNS